MPTSRAPRSLSWHIVWLCAGVAAPLLVLGSLLSWQGAASARDQLEDQARTASANLSLLIDREIAGMIATLQALATSRSLQEGDLRSFYHRARNLVDLQGTNVVLRDLDGRQLVNTRVPWGTPLPAPALLESDKLAIATHSPQVSGVFTGAVAGLPLFMVEVPILRDGEPVYLLNLSYSADRITRLIANKGLPHGWWATVADADGIILARTINPETIGRKVVPGAMAALRERKDSAYIRSPEGVNNFSAFSRSDLTGWTTGVAVPEPVLLAPLYMSLVWMGATAALSVALSVALGMLYGRRLAGSVTGLTRAVLSLGRGEPLPAVVTPVREIAQAGQALASAKAELDARSLERDELLRTLGRSPSFVRGFDGVIEFWGQGAQMLYGWSPQEAVGRVSHDLLQTDLGMPLAAVNGALVRDGLWEGEVRHRTMDGRTVIVASHWALRRDPRTGQPLAVVETNSDLTAQKAAERALEQARLEAERALSAKSRFLAAASHDLRQPLQALHLYLEVLAGRLAPAEKPIMQAVRQCLGSLSSLLNDMLDLSKFEAGVVAAVPSDIRLADLFGKIAHNSRPVAEEKGLRLRVVPTAAVARTDPALLERIVGNLVSNAVRYTQTGGVVIGCRRHGGRLWIEVWDSGIGIPADAMSEIFEEYVQLGNPERSGSKGSGLGLSIVRKAAAVLGVQVRVASRCGRGSMFAIEVPQAPADAAAAVGQQRRSDGSTALASSSGSRPAAR